MRKFHRWAMTVFVVFLLYAAVSGVLLELYDYTDATEAFAREGGGAGARTPTNLMGVDVSKATPLTHEDLSPLLATALAAAQRSAPEQPIASLEFHVEQGAALASVNIGIPQSQQLRIGAAGEAVSAPQQATPANNAVRNWHASIKSWHRGIAFGPLGATAIFLTGCAFLTLCMTGVLMYFNLWNARRRGGRQHFFWS